MSDFRQLHPQRPSRYGQSVTFAPPPGAYSPKSLQWKCAGMRGTIVASGGDDYAMVLIGNRKVLCNTAYLVEN